jgi:ABC-type phosphate transport system substrate-binding protein
MKRLILLPTILALAAIAQPVAAQGFVLVTNGANPAASLSKQQAASIFLKKAAKWPSGLAAAPIDQGKQSKIRDTFARAVHGKAASALDAYWQQQIFSGGDVPPPEKGSDADVLEFVRSNKGALGYVSAGAALGADVKAVTIAP